MNASLRVLLGVVVACAGLVWLSQEPFSAVGALLAGGFLILEGIDRFCQNIKFREERFTDAAPKSLCEWKE